MRRERPARSRVGTVIVGGAAVVALAIALAAGAPPAFAHAPVFVTTDDPTPIEGPLLEDGRISYAVYGTLTGAGDTRGLRTYLTQGDPLVADLLIPAQEPEQSLPVDQLPRVTIRLPDGTTRAVAPDMRERFDEPFSQTSYWRLAQLDEPAPQTGVYEMTVTGGAPERFTLATGTLEGAPGTVTGAEPVPAGGLMGWYSTPPAPAPPAPAATAPAAPADDGIPWAAVAVVAALAAILVATTVWFVRRRPRAGT